MMNSIKQLWDIQELELQQTKNQRLLKEDDILKDLRVIKQEIESGMIKFKVCKEEYNKIKMEITKTEEQVVKLNDEIAELNNKLLNGAISNQKEITGIYNKLENLKQKVTIIEEKELLLMEEQEVLIINLEKYSEYLKAKEKVYNQLKEQYKNNQDKLKQKLQQLQIDKEKLSKDITKEIMQLFKSMKKQFKKPVAIVDNGICNGCHMRLTLYKLKQLKNSAGLVKCDNCGRLIFIDTIE